MIGPLALTPLLPAQFLEGTDWVAVGLVLAIVGGFLLANSILFRHPRAMVEEYFTGPRGQIELRPVGQYVFHRVQVNLGFLLLLSGFGLQLFGHVRPLPAGVEPSFPAAWIGWIAIGVILLEGIGWWWSRFLFRHHVRRFLRETPVDFETNTQLAREVGELFGLESSGEDTVQSYVARLRQRIGLSVREERHARTSLTELEPEAGESA